LTSLSLWPWCVNFVLFSGIAPNADVFVVKVFDEGRNFFNGFMDGTTYSTDLIAAAQICKDAGADIISASLGGRNYNQMEEDFFNNLYTESGILMVAAAGNGGDERNIYPAGYDGGNY
jgi:subtilisin family serine protease